MSSHALIFANGDIDDGPMVQQALEMAVAPVIVAADGGARGAQHFGLPIDVLVGDMDSLSQRELDALIADGVDVRQYPPEKDFTDLELALQHLIERDVTWIRIIGGLGGRLDQALANVYLLALPSLRQCDVRLVAGKQETRLLYPGQYLVHGSPGDTVSLIPVGGDVHGIYTEQLAYPLTDETLYFGPARGISNVMQMGSARVTVDEGMLLLVHTIGRA